MAEITNIACRRLHPHPDNPRKELGDLTELAASIKENGIFQNLTVIPGHYLNSREYIAKCVDEGGDAAAAAAAWTPKAVWSSDDYTIIIGHRRAAAAQQAGLFEVPCVVVEMDEREQLQTMMIENMQRSDLTTYEQAQGFQLMLDLGDTVEQVASKSGFSQSTIRRRVKLLSLDRDAFRRAELRGATLSDYAELDKIESVEDKNKALEALGTQNFRRVMQEVLEKAKASTPAGAEPKRVQRKEIPKGTAYGVLRLRCPKCGDVFGRFLREPSASVTCRCGGEVQLDNLTRYEFTCPCCDFEARGRTNLEDPEITVPCKCGNPVTMKWDRNKRMYHE